MAEDQVIFPEQLELWIDAETRWGKVRLLQELSQRHYIVEVLEATNRYEMLQTYVPKEVRTRPIRPGETPRRRIQILPSGEWTIVDRISSATLKKITSGAIIKDSHGYTIAENHQQAARYTAIRAMLNQSTHPEPVADPPASLTPSQCLALEIMDEGGFLLRPSPQTASRFWILFPPKSGHLAYKGPFPYTYVNQKKKIPTHHITTLVTHGFIEAQVANPDRFPIMQGEVRYHLTARGRSYLAEQKSSLEFHDGMRIMLNPSHPSLKKAAQKAEQEVQKSSPPHI